MTVIWSMVFGLAAYGAVSALRDIVVLLEGELHEHNNRT